MDETTDYPRIDPGTPIGMRMLLLRRYGNDYILKFCAPYISGSGIWEASWVDSCGQFEIVSRRPVVLAQTIAADTEAELMTIVRDAMGDCGGRDHAWLPTSMHRDPDEEDHLMITQVLKCPGCPERERMIRVNHPAPTPYEVSRESGHEKVARKNNPALMTPEQVIGEWVDSTVKPKNAAAKMAIQLAAQAPGTLVASKEKIAVSLGVHPSTARRVRMLLQGAGFVYKSGRHLYVSDRVIGLHETVSDN